MRVTLYAGLFASSVLLNACSIPGNFSSTPGSSTYREYQSSIPSKLQSPGAANPLLVVAEDGLGRIDFFNSSGVKIGVIHNPTGSLAMDGQANIYVANYHYQWKFKIFAPPYTNKPTIIGFYNSYLRSVAVDSTSGVFAVLTNPNEAGPRSSHVSFFAHGATKPCSIVTVPSSMGTLGGAVTFDASGVLYFDYTATPETDGVASIAGECRAKAVIQYNPTIHFIGAMQFNARDELVIQQINGTLGGPIETFAHPKSGALGKLLSTTNLAQIDGQPPLMLSLSSDGNGVWAAPVFKEGVGLFKYPEGGAPTRLISGVKSVDAGAVFPQLVP